MLLYFINIVLFLNIHIMNIKRLTKKFSGRKIDVEWEDDNGFKHISPTELECLGAVTPAPNINFYEKAGVRFGYYSSYYSSY